MTELSTTICYYILYQYWTIQKQTLAMH